ncbi:MAG: hypothetical protein IKU97_00280 [Tidjanibacter sp.]|nr:hypothetical protein [Tidjanibacter sp.]
MKIHILVLIAGLMSACNIISLRDFELKSAEVVRFDMSGAEVTMTIRNKSLFKVTIADGVLKAYDGENPIGEIYMQEPVVLPGRKTTTVTLKVGLRFASPMAALRALGTLTKSPERLTISGYGEGKVLWFSKKISHENVPISKFISIFGAPSDYLSGKTL